MVKSSGENNLFFLLVLLILAFLSYFILCSYFALFRTEKGLVFELTTHQTHSTTMMRSCTICLNLAVNLKV